MRRTVLSGMRSYAVVSLGGITGLHVLWAMGSAWPARDRRTLADAVGGFNEFPGTGACLVVATFLGLATVSVAGIPGPLARVTRIGSAVTSFVLFLRGSIGLAGALPNSRRSRVFARWDRRLYSPLCITLAVSTLAGTFRE